MTFILCATLLMAGLCGCDKFEAKQDLPEILVGSWGKVWDKGVQDAGTVTWTFTTGLEQCSEDPNIMQISVTDMTGSQSFRYIYRLLPNEYMVSGSGIPQIELYNLDHNFNETLQPEATYNIDVLSSKELVLERIDVNVTGPNPFEQKITLRRK